MPGAPQQLRCEYAQNPLGLDATHPSLSWIVNDARRGAVQTAYQIIVASSPDKLKVDQADLWDSGKVRSDTTAHIEYAGEMLRSHQRCFWKVRTWDSEDKVSPWSAAAVWEMALLHRDDWHAKWIGSPVRGSKYAGVPVPYLRKTFALDRPVASARLYITALGIYEAYINGKLVSHDVFRPGWTDYNKRVQYQTYDVTALLRDGDNALGSILADGWYCGHLCWNGRQNYGEQAKLKAQLLVTFDDGSTQVISTDESWKTQFGPIVASDMLMGESYDARLEINGWDEPWFNDQSWWEVRVFAEVNIAHVAQRGPAVRRQEELRPIAKPKYLPGWSQGAWLFDMGQNMVGRVRLKIRGERGTTLRIRHAEMLDADGKLMTANLRSAACTDYYTLSGDGEEVFEPRFTFHGFRYVEITGLPQKDGDTLPEDLLTGIVVHTDATATGEFECSDPLINQLQSNIRWGQKGNYLEVPTDCPQRDERLGWTGDAQVFIRTATFNMDVASFFHKWTQDVRDAQMDCGSFTSVAPEVLAHLTGTHPAVEGGPAWADAGVICPWVIYLAYGDKRILADNYDAMVRFIEFMRENSRNLIRPDESCAYHYCWGDWLSINADTPKNIIGTAYFAYCTRIVARAAKILGRDDDAHRMQQLADAVRSAFIRHFVTQDGLITSETQTAYVLALHFDLLPAQLRQSATEALVRNIRQRGNHLSVGFVGSSYLPHALSNSGRLDVAYDLLMQKTFPSWLYPVTQGATTIWERWDAWTHDKGFQSASMNSFNHYAYGAVGEWMYSVVAGLDLDPHQPGYKHVIVRPRPGGGLTHARASLQSIRGTIETRWQLERDTFRLQVTPPANTSATVHVPTRDARKVHESDKPAEQAEGVSFIGSQNGEAIYRVGSGTYTFTSKI